MANFRVTWSAVLTLFFVGSVFAQGPTAAEKFSIWLPAKPWALDWRRRAWP